MQSKLTLRMEDAVIRKAKRLSRRRGESVSKIISDYITEQGEELDMEELPPVTSSMVAVLSPEVEEADYKRYLEKKYR